MMLPLPLPLPLPTPPLPSLCDDECSHSHGETTRDHGASGGLRDKERALQIGIDHEVPVLLFDLERGCIRRDAGIVDAHIQGAEVVHHFLNAAADAADVAHVEAVRSRGSSLLLDARDQRVQPISPTGAHSHSRARLCQHARKSIAEPA